MTRDFVSVCRHPFTISATMHEDSSYDSDCETIDTVKSTVADCVDEHDEVCRTFSDTLAAEYVDYITVSKTTPFGQQHYPQQQKQITLDEVINYPNYTSRVEFGLKLGYTETQVQIALLKLGPKAGQNELLAELIKLGANSVTSKKSPIYRTSSGVKQSEATDDVTLDNYSSDLRPIVIDGSNVAMSHGNKEIFSCMGIKICVDWFKSRGHKEITVFVPMWRKESSRVDSPIKDQEILFELEAERLLVFTPSRNLGGRRMVCYDDRYILKLASECDGIVVSNDNYRDLVNETPEYKKVVEERLLMYSFVNDRFMPPDDPLGRHGPSLDNFLRKKPKPPEIFPPPCPYGKKCTYGNKCKYYHPERGNQPQKSVTEWLAEQARIQIQARNAFAKSRESSPGEKLRATHTGSLPPSLHVSDLTKTPIKMQLTRTNSDHFPVTKRFSDPDESRHKLDFSVAKPYHSSETSPVDVGPANLHKKLQRQLTLNPNCDPRLMHMANFQSKTTNADERIVSPSDHSAKNVTRLRSDSTSRVMNHQIHQQPLMSYLTVSTPHPNVTRIASAPDSHSNWPPPSSQSHIAKLNSTSDSKLNLAPNASSAFQNSLQFPGHTIWTSTALPGLMISPSSWPQNTNVRPASVPPQMMNTSNLVSSMTNVHSSPSSSSRSISLNDQRNKLRFHLSSIFPEEQVRAAMDMHPEETNAQKICATILAMFPKG
ncbi:uncharacterized protein B4U80_00340 [Leptotrombidium deliense]|uniref:C3H1-type domain-containing protein n=1 Tax=Leptotrombidium deliense TaxID=299467 RepID=A0A443SJY6_9ACAR|nr:uncharacterized protein B4U80_00340 [Leptotrombidium deliense]